MVECLFYKQDVVGSNPAVLILYFFISKQSVVMLKLLLDKKKIEHPELAQILHKIYIIIKSFVLLKNKNLKHVACFLIQMVIISEYLTLHFFTYTILGRVIIIVSGYLFINQVEPFIITLSSYLLLAQYTALLIIFYIEMQIPICRTLLIEIISEDIFNAYVGKNPGTGHLKNGLALIASTVGVGTVGFGIHTGIDVARRKILGSSYIRDCQDGGILPSEGTLDKIYTAKPPSTMETVWGSSNLDLFS